MVGDVCDNVSTSCDSYIQFQYSSTVPMSTKVLDGVLCSLDTCSLAGVCVKFNH